MTHSDVHVHKLKLPGLTEECAKEMGTETLS